MDSVSKSEFRTFKLIVYALLAIILANVTEIENLKFISIGVAFIMLFALVYYVFSRYTDG